MARSAAAQMRGPSLASPPARTAAACSSATSSSRASSQPLASWSVRASSSSTGASATGRARRRRGVPGSTEAFYHAPPSARMSSSLYFMLSVAQARDIVLAASAPLGVETIPVADALGRTLAAPVSAAYDTPPFANSAMDGYAVMAGPAGRELAVVGESRAGAPSPLAL